MDRLLYLLYAIRYGYLRQDCEMFLTFVFETIPILYLSLLLRPENITHKFLCVPSPNGSKRYYYDSTNKFNVVSRSRDYKTFFMLNSVEHEILNAHKYKNIKKFCIC